MVIKKNIINRDKIWLKLHKFLKYFLSMPRKAREI